jgi:hypothetical protein
MTGYHSLDVRVLRWTHFERVHAGGESFDRAKLAPTDRKGIFGDLASNPHTSVVWLRLSKTLTRSFPEILTRHQLFRTEILTRRQLVPKDPALPFGGSGPAFE